MARSAAVISVGSSPIVLRRCEFMRLGGAVFDCDFLTLNDNGDEEEFTPDDEIDGLEV